MSMFSDAGDDAIMAHHFFTSLEYFLYAASI